RRAVRPRRGDRSSRRRARLRLVAGPGRSPDGAVRPGPVREGPRGRLLPHTRAHRDDCRGRARRGGRRMIDVLVPKCGVTMDEADVLRWLKQVGEHVTEGEPILELETDKATGEVESPASGVLAETLVQSGDTVEPGQLVGRIEPA